MSNNTGYNSLLAVTREIINRQKNHVKAEKERIKQKHKQNANSYSQGAHNDNQSSREEVVFELRFKNFVSIRVFFLQHHHHYYYAYYLLNPLSIRILYNRSICLRR